MPIFAGGKGNAPDVQLLDAAGIVEGFEPYEVPDAPRIEAPTLMVSVGSPGIHAFAFGRDDVIVVGDDGGRQALANRMEDSLLLERPMLGMELASLLRMADLRDGFAAAVHSQMGLASADAADRWRDLSVLTTDLRQELACTTGIAGEAAGAIVACVRGGTVMLLGLSTPVSDALVEKLDPIAVTVISRLTRLSRTPRAGWRVAVPVSQSPIAPQRADAAVIIATETKGHRSLRAPWPAVPNLLVHHGARDLFSSDPETFTRSVLDEGLPLFLVHDAEDSEAAGGRDWRGEQIHAIAVGSPRACSPREGREVTVPTTFIPVTGIRGSLGAERHLVNAVRLAIAMEIELRRGGVSQFGTQRSLLRTRVSGRATIGDAWATLYDRAWNMGLAPWAGLQVPVIASSSSDDVGEALFFDSPPGIPDGDLVRETLR